MRKIISHKRGCDLRVPSLQRFLELVDDIELRGHGCWVFGKRCGGDLSYRLQNVLFSKPDIGLGARTPSSRAERTGMFRGRESMTGTVDVFHEMPGWHWRVVLIGYFVTPNGVRSAIFVDEMGHSGRGISSGVHPNEVLMSFGLSRRKSGRFQVPRRFLPSGESEWVNRPSDRSPTLTCVLGVKQAGSHSNPLTLSAFGVSRISPPTRTPHFSLSDPPFATPNRTIPVARTKVE